MKRIITASIALAASVTHAAAQTAKEPYNPGLGELNSATQLATRSFSLLANKIIGISLNEIDDSRKD